MTVKHYKPSSDKFEEVTQEEFDKIETIGILDSKRLSIINIISNMSREELKEIFTPLYEMLYKYRKDKTWL